MSASGFVSNDVSNLVEARKNKKNQPKSVDRAVGASSTTAISSAFVFSSNDHLIPFENNSSALTKVAGTDSISSGTRTAERNSTLGSIEPAKPEASLKFQPTPTPSREPPRLNESYIVGGEIKADVLKEKQNNNSSRSSKKGDLEGFVAISTFCGVAFIGAMVFVISQRISKDYPGESDDEEEDSLK
jgi:hypothetical protein